MTRDCGHSLQEIPDTANSTEDDQRLRTVQGMTETGQYRDDQDCGHSTGMTSETAGQYRDD
ncbi:unnamed protein product, partial [Staurois parvus]